MGAGLGAGRREQGAGRHVCVATGAGPRRRPAPPALTRHAQAADDIFNDGDPVSDAGGRRPWRRRAERPGRAPAGAAPLCGRRQAPHAALQVLRQVRLPPCTCRRGRARPACFARAALTLHVSPGLCPLISWLPFRRARALRPIDVCSALLSICAASALRLLCSRAEHLEHLERAEL